MKPDHELIDRWNIVYIVFYLIGLSSHVSKNFIMATDYWMYKFRNASATEDAYMLQRTDLQAEFVSIYSVIALAGNYAFVALAMIFGRKINVEKQIVGTCLTTLVCFGLTMAFIEVDTDDWQRGFLAVQLAIGGLLTAACGIMMANTFQISEPFPSRYLTATLSGHSVSGIASSLVQIASLSMLHLGSQTVAFAYFTVGFLLVLLTLAMLLVVKKKSEFYKHYIRKKLEPAVKKDQKPLAVRVKKVVMEIKWYLLGAGLVVFGTVPLEPGTVALIVSTNTMSSSWEGTYFVPVISYLLYHILDFIGREAGSKYHKPKNGIILSIAALLRLAFIPLFMFCNLQPRYNLPVIFKDDYIFIILMVLFSITNGYLLSACVMNAKSIPCEEDKQIASNLVLATISATALCFSFLNIAIVNIL